MGKIISWRNYIVIKINRTKGEKYYTVSNLKNNCHAHFSSFDEASLVARWALKNKIPKHLSKKVQYSIGMVIGTIPRGEGVKNKVNEKNK